MKKNRDVLLLIIIVIVAGILFLIIYQNSQIPVESPTGDSVESSSLSDWDIMSSSMNGAPLEENKVIYEQDSSLYDVYITIFPTEDEDNEMLTFSSFDLHTSRDHSYNPILDCNIQVLDADERLDPLLVTSVKNATIRVRGNSSRGDEYKSYKVKLDEDATGFYGLTTFNINKHSEDVIKVSTKLCTDLLADIPDIASFRTYFMKVYFRDFSLPAKEQRYVYYGLYTNIEQPNKTYLEVRGLSADCVMYKASNFSFYLDEDLKNVDEPSYDEVAFEEVLSIREGEDHTKLLEMLEAVNDETRDFQEVFDTYFNEENYLTWLAFNLLTGNDDIINHNFIIYSPNNANTWYFIPWDFDGALHYGEFESSLMQLPDSLKGGQKLNQNILFKRYFRLPGSMDKIQKKMEELLADYITEEKIQTLLDSYLPVLEETLIYQPDIGLLEMPPSELETYMDGLYGYIVSNYEMFKYSTQFPTPMYINVPEQMEDDTVYFSWEPSYSYQERTITYNIKVADDYYMNQIIFEEEGLLSPEYHFDQALTPGTYYLMVTAVDSAGNEQLNMERYETMLTDIKGLNVNGVLEFTIE